MNIKRFFTVSLALCIVSGLFAQMAQNVTYANKKQIEDFFNTKTMIVMDADPLIGYNIVISNAAKKYWTLTPYDLITSDQFENMRSDPQLSFIFLSRVQREKDKDEVYYLFMNVVLGAKVKDLNKMPTLLMLPLAYTGVDEDNYVDILPLMLRFTQVHLNNLKTAKNPSLVYNLKNYSSEAIQLKNKTLLVKESDLSEEVNTIEKIQQVYAGTVKIVSSEEIVQAIEEKAPDTAILHQIGPSADENKGRSYCQIFSTDNAKMYYHNNVNITQRRPEGMLARDFRLISGKWF